MGTVSQSFCREGCPGGCGSRRVPVCGVTEPGTRGRKSPGLTALKRGDFRTACLLSPFLSSS